MGGAGLVTVTVLVWPPHPTEDSNHTSYCPGALIIGLAGIVACGASASLAPAAMADKPDRQVLPPGGEVFPPGRERPAALEPAGVRLSSVGPDLRVAGLRHWQPAVHLSGVVQGAGDPLRVVEALVDRKRLLRPCEGSFRRAGYELGGAEAKQHEGLAAFIAGVPVERERLYQCRPRLLEALEKHQRVAAPREGLGAVSRRQCGRIAQRPLVPPL